MTLDLARLEALAAAAIYPWPNDLDLHFRDGFPPETARLIAACDRTTVQALCARIRALEAVAEGGKMTTLQSVIDDLCEALDERIRLLDTGVDYVEADAVEDAVSDLRRIRDTIQSATI